MQGEEFKEISFEQGSINDCLLDDLLNFEEKKESLNMHEGFISVGNQNGKGSGRGKGRPKGEKNSKNGEKKGKGGQTPENSRKGHWSV